MLLSHLRQPLRAVGAASVIVSLAHLSASGQGAALGQFEGHGDIGAPKIAGTAVYNAVSQEYDLSAGGVNMWAQKDEFHFVWKRMTGDFILQARVELLGKGVDPHRKVGLMVRPSQDADAPYVDGMVHGDGLTSLQFRRTKGAITEQVESAVKGADIIQIERKGQTYIFSAAKFGEPFTNSQVADVNLGDDVLVGLALCSHNGDVTERAVFKDVRLVRPMKDGFKPYADYIGSVLEILDVQTGTKQVIYRSEQPFEAPNWTTDGAALIYNTSGRVEGRGRLHRFDLLTRQPTRHRHRHQQPQQQRPRALVRRHDARHQRPEHARATGSTIYTVPVGGGTPKRITQLAPSYLHGWSPDGEVAGLHRRARRRVRHLPHRVRRQRGTRAQPRPVQGARRRSGVLTGRQVHLLQLDAQRDDADLADAARRHRPGAGDRATSTTTGSRTSRRTASRSSSSASPRTIEPSDHPYVQARISAADAGRRRRGQR